MTSMPPKASAEQLELARANSIKTRQERAELRRSVTGSKDPRRAFLDALREPEAAGMSILALLIAIPNVGLVRAGKMLDAAGIPRKNTVRRCGAQQLERLKALL